MFKVIVTGTDGSETATRAVRAATALAAMHHADLHIASVVQVTPPMSAVGGEFALGGEWATAADDAAKVTVRTAADLAANAGVRAFTHTPTGDPAASIIRIAEEVDADLIVVGNRGMKGVSRFVLGSVPNRIAHHAPCSVHIVRTH